ncbi:hypothetical protein Taro_035955, partial [Colocasia esculenta]|nr:hypothetical protein [Colocasia esculenta]
MPCVPALANGPSEGCYHFLGPPAPRVCVRGSCFGRRACSSHGLGAEGENGGGSAVSVRCGPASPSHCLALRWFQSHVGKSGVGPQLGRAAMVVPHSTGEVVGRSQQLVSARGGLCVPLLAACGGGLVALAVTMFHAVSEIGFLVALACTAPNCSFCNPFIGAFVVAPAGVCQGVCFRIVFDSAGSTRVVFGLTRVVVESSFASAFLEFLLLWLEFVAGRLWWRFVALCVASSVSCECEHLYRELRVAFLQVLELFEFIAYLTGLNSNPSGSSDPWVAAQPSASLAGVQK